MGHICCSDGKSCRKKGGKKNYGASYWIRYYTTRSHKFQCLIVWLILWCSQLCCWRRNITVVGSGKYSLLNWKSIVGAQTPASAPKIPWSCSGWPWALADPLTDVPSAAAHVKSSFAFYWHTNGVGLFRNFKAPPVRRNLFFHRQRKFCPA